MRIVFGMFLLHFTEYDWYASPFMETGYALSNNFRLNLSCQQGPSMSSRVRPSLLRCVSDNEAPIPMPIMNWYVPFAFH